MDNTFIVDQIGWLCFLRFEIMKNISKELINIKHKKIIPLTIEEFESWKNCDVCYLCNEKFEHTDKNYRKLRNNCRFTGK